MRLGRYTGAEGIYTHTVGYERDPECLECSPAQLLEVSPSHTLQQVPPLPPPPPLLPSPPVRAATLICFHHLPFPWHSSQTDTGLLMVCAQAQLARATCVWRSLILANESMM